MFPYSEFSDCYSLIVFFSTCCSFFSTLLCAWEFHLLHLLNGSLNNETRTTFLGAEACLLAGSARNAYHTKYRGKFNLDDLSCATLRKGVFAAAAALTLLSLIGANFYYWSHSKADTGGWEKHRNEGLGMSNYGEHEQQQQQTTGFEKV